MDNPGPMRSGRGRSGRGNFPARGEIIAIGIQSKQLYTNHNNLWFLAVFFDKFAHGFLDGQCSIGRFAVRHDRIEFH